MSFVMLPPEVNSGRMYSGPGSGPMLAAAAAWDELAAELYSTAEHYGSVISGLTAGTWSGPAATKMGAAGAPHVTWLMTTAGAADQAAAQAKAAAGAYAQAYAMTVPPAVVAANRAHYLMLVATNLFGQNAPAIGAAEAQYAEYWAQDGEAMDGYAAQSTAVTHGLTAQQFSPMAQTSDGGLSQTAAAVSTQAQSTFAAGQGLMPALQQTLGGLASPAQSGALLQQIADLFQLPPIINEPLGSANAIGGFLSSFLSLPAIIGSIWGTTSGNWGIILGTAAAVEATEAATAEVGFVEPTGTTPTATMASAGLGQAPVVGGLSVPPSWADTAPALRLAAATLPVTSVGTAGNGLLSGMPLFGGAPLATVAGRGVGGSFSRNRPQTDSANRRAAAGKGGSKQPGRYESVPRQSGRKATK